MSKKSLSLHLKTCTKSKCRNSENVSITKAFLPDHYPLLNVQCPDCGTVWLVCPEHGIKWSRRRYKYAKDHLKNIPHNTHYVSNNEEFCIPIPQDDNNESMDESENSEDSILSHIFPFNESNICSNDNSSLSFFFNNEIKETFSGLKLMIGNAFSGIVSSSVTDCSLEEINFHLHGLKFTMSLSQRQRYNFSYHNSLFISALKIDNPLNENAFQCSRPPLDIYDINMFYFSRKTSLYKNIPCPKVFCRNNHACVSIKDIITHVFAFGLEIDGMVLNSSLSFNDNSLIGPKKGVSICKQSKIIRENVRSRLRSHRQSVSPLIVYVTLWSDDFEPNNVIKHKRKSWLKTITIAPPEYSKVSHHYTYIIAIGSSNYDHEPIHSFFWDELKDLQKVNYIYSSLCGRNIPIVVETMAICADRPERSSMNKMLSHNGLTTSRWKYSCIIKEPNKFKSCKSCVNKTIKILYCKLKGQPTNSIQNIPCNLCSHWNFGNRLMRFSPSEKYPKKQHRLSPPAPKYRSIASSNFKIRSIEITYKYLKQATIFCIHNVFTKKWNKGTAYAYLKHVGISDSFAKKNIVKYAYNCREDGLLSLQDCINGFTHPSIWSSPINLYQCVDAPMHLLFLGIQKSIMTLTMNWLTGLSPPQYKKFGDIINPLLKKIDKMNLSWIRVNAFSSPREYTLGGWISSHYSAFSRIMCVAYSPIRNLVTNVNESIDHFERMILITNICFSLLLSKDNKFNPLVLDTIKLFLSMVDNFECSVLHSQTTIPSSSENNIDQRNPTWMKSNFLSILNLPYQIKQFGHLRYFWDGTHERAIQNIKPYLKKARSTDTYFKKKMEEMYTNQFIDLLCNYFYHKCRLNNVNEFQFPEYKSYERYDNFKIYSPTTNIMRMLEKKRPLSGVLFWDTDTNNYHSVILKRDPNSTRIQCFQLNFDPNNGYYHIGHYFVFIETVSMIKVYDNKSEIDDVQYSYILLLPDMQNDDYDENGYTIITDDWKTLRKNNVYDFVLFNKKMFSNI